MKTFDPKEKKGRFSGESHSEKPARKSFPRRDDSGSRNDYDSPSEFMKDQRKERRPRLGNTPREDNETPRRSFNPNFTRDNRRKDDGSARYNDRFRRDDDRPGRDDDRRSGKPFRKNDKPYSSYGDEERPYRNNRSENDRGGNRSYHKDSRDGEHSFRKDAYRKDNAPRRDSRDSRDGERPFRKDDRRGSYSDRRSGYGDRRENSGDRYGDRREGGQRAYGNHKGFKKYDSTNYPRFEAPKQSGAVRLNRFIANSGICSRREADDLITAGVVSVNGQVVSELGTKVYPSDEVRFNGEVIHGEKHVYILMNKPKGYVTSLEDPHADKTVMDLVRNACTERVYPVGRLDKNSVGVLLITNDGDLTRQLTHPSYKKSKIYQVSLDKPLSEEDMQRIADGIELEDGMIYADEVSYVSDSRKEIGIEIHSGRNRIVRRIFEALGYSVQKLDRVYFAGLTKKGLKRGAWRFLTPREVSMLKSGEYE